MNVSRDDKLEGQTGMIVARHNVAQRRTACRYSARGEITIDKIEKGIMDAGGDRLRYRTDEQVRAYS